MLTNNNLKRRSQPGFGARTLFAVIIAGTLHSGFAETPSAPAFDSTEQAIEALYTAINHDDDATITRLIGPLASSGDMVQDKADRQLFTRKFTEMHRLAKEPDGTTVLYVGAENWPFPVPLVSDHGKWRFDPDAGAREITFRRIGENEMTAIETCRAIAHPDRATENTAISDYVLKVVGDFCGALLRVSLPKRADIGRNCCHSLPGGIRRNGSYDLRADSEGRCVREGSGPENSFTREGHAPVQTGPDVACG